MGEFQSVSRLSQNQTSDSAPPQHSNTSSESNNAALKQPSMKGMSNLPSFRAAYEQRAAAENDRSSTQESEAGVGESNRQQPSVDLFEAPNSQNFERSTEPRGICTEFGNFLIYPDSFTGPLPRNPRDAESWHIRQSDYDRLISQLETIKQGTSQIILAFGSPKFYIATYLDLGWLMTTGVGQDLIEEIQNSSHQVTIEETTSYPSTQYSPDADSWEIPGSPPTPGPGSDVIVLYNPNFRLPNNGPQDWRSMPPAIALAHEMVHAWTGVHGTRAVGNDAAGVKRRELQAVGIGEFSNARLSENRFRAAFGLPLRPVY